MGGMAITPDNTIMALAEDFLSRRQYGIRFRNLETGNWYPELLDNVEPSFVWANDSGLSTMYASIQLRCCLIRSGVTPSVRQHRKIN